MTAIDSSALETVEKSGESRGNGCRIYSLGVGTCDKVDITNVMLCGNISYLSSSHFIKVRKLMRWLKFE